MEDQDDKNYLQSTSSDLVCLVPVVYDGDTQTTTYFQLKIHHYFQKHLTLIILLNDFVFKSVFGFGLKKTMW